jgi:hypothetical protein
MMPAQLKETTMDPAKRTLLRVGMGEDEGGAGEGRRGSSWATSRRDEGELDVPTHGSRDH